MNRASSAYKSIIASLIGLLLLALVLPTAHASHIAHDQTLNIEADQMTYDVLSQLAVFTGHVIVTKGEILIRADRIDVRQDPQRYQYATGISTDNRLSYFRKKRDSIDEYIEGNAVCIHYDGKQNLTTLTTHAAIRRLHGMSQVLDEVHGSVITYNCQTNFYTAQSGKDIAGPGNPSGRVHAMLIPRIEKQHAPPF
ncbi:lipopolysaccharide transport periplasmic protein LptA [Candidatus Vallotia tarda]|nr:lipopolysaccharide transport periplasmic protein LptA [Candidatus Vallotia tarda]